MVEVLTAHKQEIEKELRERVQAFFDANDVPVERVSIEMKLSEIAQSGELSTIHIRVKDSCTH